MRLLAASGVLAAGLAAAAVFSGIGRPEAARSETAPATGGITTSGMGTVETVPDRASFSFGVETVASTAREALEANGERLRRVIGSLQDAGVAAKDIRTQQLSLQARYADDGKTVTGYAATNTVQAEIRELARAGATVDAAVEAGANQVWGPSLSRSDRDALARDALRKAVADARAKAEALADAAGVRLGGAVRIVEGTPAYEPPMPYAERAAALDAATPIQPGTEQIEATVTVTFSLA
jgi:uncharacterized protein YggE